MVSDVQRLAGKRDTPGEGLVRICRLDSRHAARVRDWKGGDRRTRNATHRIRMSGVPAVLAVANRLGRGRDHGREIARHTVQLVYMRDRCSADYAATGAHAALSCCGKYLQYV